jgi:hypothetical protein
MSTRTINLDNAELIGDIGVDSGQIMICDPCYIESSWEDDNDFSPGSSKREKPENTNFSYAGACETTLAKSQAGIIGPGLGAVTSSGFGDGRYPVYVEFSDEGAWGRRVKSMTIVFIDDSEQESDEDEACDGCGGEMYGFHNGFVCPDCEANANDDEGDE